MSFHGGLANSELRSNLFVACILVNQTRDLFFASGELIYETVLFGVDKTLPVFSQDANFFEEALDDLSSGPNFSPLNNDHCFFQQGRFNVSLAVPPRAEFKGGEFLIDFWTIGKDDDSRQRAQPLNRR